MRNCGILLLVLALAAHCPAGEPSKVTEAWASDGSGYKNTDSLAAVMLSSGAVRIYATSKDGNRLEIIDASTGKHGGTWGEAGSGVGQLKYPNGIATVTFGKHGDPNALARAALAVVERDNKRVQFLWPESGKPAGTFGEEQLTRPYGVAVSREGEKTLVYVTDTKVEPDQTVQVFELRLNGEQIEAKHVRHFGEQSGPGAIGVAESILVDDSERRVLICDERAKNVKLYDTDGRFTGKTFGDGLVVGDPEGLVLVDAKDARLIILTDQRKDLSVWHVFDARSLKHAGSWTGSPTVANTDGIAVFPHAFEHFPDGALFAVDDDFEVRAYRLGDVLKSVGAAPAE